MTSPDLAANPCRDLCCWRPSRAGAQLFACSGCGSQWEPGQPWTPADADGVVPEAVRAVRRG